MKNCTALGLSGLRTSKRSLSESWSTPTSRFSLVVMKMFFTSSMPGRSTSTHFLPVPCRKVCSNWVLYGAAWKLAAYQSSYISRSLVGMNISSCPRFLSTVWQER